VRVWWNVNSPSRRSVPASSTASRRAICVAVGDAFINVIGSCRRLGRREEIHAKLFEQARAVPVFELDVHDLSALAHLNTYLFER